LGVGETLAGSTQRVSEVAPVTAVLLGVIAVVLLTAACVDAIVN
jgi:hypothetical protein